MALNTMVKAIVPTDVADAARDRAETDGKTLADAVVELLADYAESKPKRTRKKT